MGKIDSWIEKPIRYQIVSTIHVTIWMLLVMVICKQVLLPALIMGNSFGFVHNSSMTSINDFPSHFNLAKEAWFSKVDRSSVSSIYSVENHLNVTSKWVGSNVTHSLSFGYSPTMLWLLAPLVFFSHASAFCIFNLAGLWSIWWQTRPFRSRLGVGVLSFLSPLGYACMMLGQTALISGACLLYISENTQKQSQTSRIRSTICTGTALWVLTAKPPLAVTAAAVLVALRKWQPILFALILTMVMTLAISPLLGPNWANDYFNLLGRHNLVEADKAFAWSHCPPHMANLRAILNVDFNFGDNIASRISTIFWFCALVCMMTLGARLRLQQAGYWALGILFYLVFCPHVSSTEELQLILLIPLCIPVMKKILKLHETALLAFLLLLPFMSPAVGPFFMDVRWGLFVAKIALVFYVVYFLSGEPATEVRSVDEILKVRNA